MSESFKNARYAELVAKAWVDEAFRQQLLSDPRAVLPAYGISIPEGVEIRMVENTEKVYHFTLPPKPGEEISDEQLDLVAGGAAPIYCCCCPCCCWDA